MSLRAGSSRAGGVIVGSGGIDRRTPSSLLDPVAQALKTHHGLTVSVNHGTYTQHGPFPLDRESPAIAGGGKGKVLRVFYGAGHLKINGKQAGDVDSGDWLYIPSGASSVLTGSVISGMHLKFGVAELK